METRDDIKGGCKACKGKGWLVKDGVRKSCADCCTHSGQAVSDPRNPEKLMCGQGCGEEVKVEMPKKAKAKAKGKKK